MIYEKELGIFQAAVNINGIWWADDMVIKWMKKLKYRDRVKFNTRSIYIHGLDLFLHYYIYKPYNYKISLIDYLSLFREELINGLEIKIFREIKTNSTHFSTDYFILKKEPYSVKTINIYMDGIQDYLDFLKIEKIDENIESVYDKEIDWIKLKQKSIYGKGGGYGLIMSPLVARILAPKKKLLNHIRVHRNTNKLNCYFPPEIFEELLNISNPREQAIYLLCAYAATRIGQALSLTRDDYNTETREVFIVDPTSDEKGPSGKLPRNVLIKKIYNINMEEKPYRQIACKYPIPSQYTELLWFNNKYKEKFFKALSLMDKGNPLTNGHPFIFHTKSGKILTPNECYRIFDIKIKKLKKIILKKWQEKRINIQFEDKKYLDKHYEYLLSQLEKVSGLHSLRHTYAILWADLSIINPNLSIEKAQSLCQFGMGQSSIKSLLNYFTIRKETREKYILNQLENSNNYLDNTYLNNKLYIVNEYSKRSH